MYLHIGKDIIIRKKDILFLLDYDNLKENKTNKNLFENITKEIIIDSKDKKIKTIIITKQKEGIKAYLTNISTMTLAKRNKI